MLLDSPSSSTLPLIAVKHRALADECLAGRSSRRRDIDTRLGCLWHYWSLRIVEIPCTQYEHRRRARRRKSNVAHRVTTLGRDVGLLAGTHAAVMLEWLILRPPDVAHVPAA
ncbi:hypothetical protein BDZ89DRAFT_507298 [Hymenopellis radicata]|nr:hypothetical protein BDZ89DRAFT_507298 [Hymenopellis radicata]